LSRVPLLRHAGHRQQEEAAQYGKNYRASLDSFVPHRPDLQSRDLTHCKVQSRSVGMIHANFKIGHILQP
jgi:hypothetical protein